MTTDVPQVEGGASVLDASGLMNDRKKSGAVVFEGGKPVGMLTEGSLLRRFAPLDEKPSEVLVREVMAPLLKISADAPIKEAAKLILENSLTRVGVFDGDKLVGWVTLTDIARQSSKKSLIDSLRRENVKFPDDELICPNCRSAVMRKVVGKNGVIIRWECPKCGHEE